MGTAQNNPEPQTLTPKRRKNIQAFFVCLTLCLLFFGFLWQGVKLLSVKSFPETLKNELFSAAEAKYVICVELNNCESGSLDMLYYVFPGLRTVNTGAGVSLIVLGLCSFIALIRSLQTRNCVPGRLIPIIAGAFILRFLYCAAAACVMKVPLSILIKYSAMALTASGILIILLILIRMVSAKRNQGRI